MENNTNTGTVYSNPNMTPDQMAVFEKECIWSDGWFTGYRRGNKNGLRSGYIAGLAIGAVSFLAASAILWYKENRNKANQNKKEDESNAEN